MLTIRGHSDDIVMANITLEKECPHCGAEVEEPTQAVVALEGSDDEIPCYDQEVYITVGSLEGGVSVKMVYGPGGCWAALIHPVGEGVPIPWPVAIEAEGYTVIVKVSCPRGTPVLVKKASS